MATTLKASPGRVVLRFPPPEATFGESNLVRPENYRLRPEFGEIVDVGEPFHEGQAGLVDFFREAKEAGVPVPVSFGSGVSYLQHGYSYPDKWKWLGDFRTYRIEELSAVLVEE